MNKLALIMSPERGLRIRALREKAGISQTELARAIGRDQPTVSRIERFGIGPASLPVRIFCEALGVTVQDLIGDSPSLVESRITPPAETL